VEISLLRSVRILSMLPGPVLEGLARALTPRAVRAGEVLIREGDAGDAFYAIADGRFRVSRAGRTLRDVGRGDGVGEIALLRDVPRTASVAAETDALVYTLPREAFLVATTGHAPTHLLAHEVAQSLLDDGGPGEAPR
jgi:CRP-like cAMP-binding protein